VSPIISASKSQDNLRVLNFSKNCTILDVVVDLSGTVGSTGVIVAANTFFDVDQSSPLRTFTSAIGDGISITLSGVPSSVDDVVLSVVAMDETFDINFSANGPSAVKKWDLRVSDNNGAGSIQPGASPSATVDWGTNGDSDYAVGAISIVGASTQPSSSSPSAIPSMSPSDSPTLTTTDSPSTSPSLIPTNYPSSSPSQTPTSSPSRASSISPSSSPSRSPFSSPTTPLPSFLLTIAPSYSSTKNSDTNAPSTSPSRSPSLAPSLSPSRSPTTIPSSSPSSSPFSSPFRSPEMVGSRANGQS